MRHVRVQQGRSADDDSDDDSDDEDELQVSPDGRLIIPAAAGLGQRLPTGAVLAGEGRQGGGGAGRPGVGGAKKLRPILRGAAAAERKKSKVAKVSKTAGDKYKNKKGGGDVKRAGQLEPYA
jgi:hypothetical protein